MFPYGNEEDFLNHKFYHIPGKRLSNVRLGVEYLAFYQSKKSFSDEGGIKYFAKINNIVKYKRGECKELPVVSLRNLEKFIE